MRAQVTEKIGGKAVIFALPLGALEEIAEINPQLGEVKVALDHDVWRADELLTVIRTALRHGDANGVDAEAVYEAIGMNGAIALARNLLDKAWGEPKKKADTAAAAPQAAKKRAS